MPILVFNKFDQNSIENKAGVPGTTFLLISMEMFTRSRTSNLK